MKNICLVFLLCFKKKEENTKKENGTDDLFGHLLTYKLLS